MTANQSSSTPGTANQTLNAWPLLTSENFKDVITCMSSGELSGSGLAVINAFERRAENWFGGGHVVSTSSGTDALTVALLALGIRPHDVVLVPSYTWGATAMAPLLIGATPRFVDIDRNSYNIDPEALTKAMAPDVKAVIAVHIHGMSCDMDPIMDIARSRGVPVIEDCAQAHGALYKNRQVGLLSDMGCFSMQKSKHFSAGDGGFLVTRDPVLAQQARNICNFGLPTPKQNYRFEEGQRDGYAVYRECEQIGGMYRLNPLSAALVKDQLEHLQPRIESLQAAMAPLLATAAQIPFLQITQPAPHQTHVWHKIRVGIGYEAVDHYGMPMADLRQGLRNSLAKSGIASTLWTAPILPLQKVFRPYAGTFDWTKSAGHLAIENSFIVFDEKYPLIAQEPATMASLVSKLRQVWTDHFSALA
ncbi:DegT/DnrJ/EryC1/StrS family aminotransferase [Rhizobium leguminosarum]|uniref:DegT/DnrJ/EryC1/StrS aminotransferase family protein n=1 Tax=Rhizobium leguminosarum TaxID=384 RepID=UPI001C9383E4|nr:DegT/DnrJ/EryC1/StrS family aminotransferase [Rhizobium leguminosarum]MBY5579200.1 DegT/DnrJ/EryC1/StrS family aminotransferase [Rhizobium leguminosarum]